MNCFVSVIFIRHRTASRGEIMTRDVEKLPADNIPAADAEGDGVSRRAIIQSAVATGMVGLVGVVRPDDAEARALTNVRFTHGVASGDPLATSVILWTRLLQRLP